MKTQINVTTTQKIIAAVIVLLLFVMGCFTGIAFYNFNMKKVPASVEQKLPEKTCEAIEKLLKQELIAESSLSFRDHEINANVYKKLATNGCPENIEIYGQLVQRELQIANALNQEGRAPLMVSETEATCVQIESFLTNKLQERYSGSMNAYDHIDRAQIYANLSERGCANHSEEYKDLAKRELEIARALEDDRIDNREDIVDMVETYKRINMKAEAAKMIEKAKKLTDPAIDFIIQLEKIIEE